MSNYTKSTNFTAKDSLTTGDPSKKVLGAEIDTELSAVSTAIGTKADTVSPTFTGTVTLPTVAGNRTDSGNITHTGTLTMSGKSLNTAEGADVASATTTDIWTPADGNTVHITGTTTITSFGTAPQAGATRRVIFDGVLTLTHGANLNIPGAADITTAAGDSCIVYADTTTQLDIFSYTKASGTAITTTSVGGTGQTWRTNATLTSGRSVGTTYTNSSGYQIMVCVSLSGYSGGDTSIDLKVGASLGEDPPTIAINTVGVGVSNTARCFFASVIVPNGGTYRVNGPTFSNWTEYRHSNG